MEKREEIDEYMNGLIEKNVAEIKPLQAKSDEPAIQQIRVYQRRWITMMLFSLFSSICYVQWMEYSIVENIMSRYYDVSSLAIEWTGMVFMVSYGVVLLPTMYLIHKLDLRITCIIAALLTSLGSWIKVFSVERDRFYVVIIGQVIVASCQIVASSMTASVAAYWFGPQEVATAVSISTIGVTFISAFCSYTIPIIVRNHENVDDVGDDLYIVVLAYAIISTLIAIGIIIFFQNEPKLPPSKSRALQKLHHQEFEFFQPLKRIIKNKNFLLLWHAHGINIGFVNAMFTILNPLYLAHFKNGEKDVGRLCMVMTIIGSCGCAVFGRFLDKFKKFKEAMITLYLGTILGEVLFATAMYYENKWAVYAAASVLGFFGLAYYSSGFEMCAEITYPESEGISMAVLFLANQIFGAILVSSLNRIMKAYGDMAAHLCMCTILFIGFFITLLIKDVQKRQAAMNKSPECPDSFGTKIDPRNPEA